MRTEQLKELAEKIAAAMLNRPHDVITDFEEGYICVTNINVPMLADIRMIAGEHGAFVYPDYSWGFVTVEFE